MKFIQIIEDNKDAIIKLYNSGLSFNTISKYFGNLNGAAAIWSFFKQNNIPRRKTRYQKKYSCIEDYFENIDSEDKAYFLGLMYADGCVSNIKNISMRISLQEKDGYILESFKEKIKFTGNLYTKSLNKNNPNHQNQKTLCIYSRKLVKDLIKQGCVSSKSLILNFPIKEQVPDHLIHHFIRGYFDGDGCISIKRNKTNLKLHFNLAGTYQFLFNLQKILISILGISKTKIIKCGKSQAFQLNITANKDIEKIKNYLYNDNSNLFLTRKREKFDTKIGNKSSTYYTSKYKNICRRENENCWRITYYNDDGKRKEKIIFSSENDAYIKLNEIKSMLKNKGEKIC